jgi:phosphate/sulfate permease
MHATFEHQLVTGLAALIGFAVWAFLAWDSGRPIS